MLCLAPALLQHSLGKTWPGNETQWALLWAYHDPKPITKINHDKCCDVPCIIYIPLTINYLKKEKKYRETATMLDMIKMIIPCPKVVL